MNSPFSKVFFYCYPPKQRGDGSYHKAYHYYQHASVVLGEGLKELGIELYSNVNYWKLSPNQDEYLFQHDPAVTPDDCDIVVFDNIYMLSGTFPENLFHPNRKYLTVFLDISDENPGHLSFRPEFRQFDFIFKAHRNQRSWYPSNVHPWMFGLSHRMLRELEIVPEFHSRKQHLLVNFRHSQHPHTLRQFIRKHYLPKIQTAFPLDSSVDQPIDPLVDEASLDHYTLMQSAQSSGRHFPAYYQRLKQSAACACFGGFFISQLPQNQSTTISHNLRRIITKLGLKTNRIIQWDSWRWWESLAAGCVAFHVDFEKYGFHLPVMPENGVHYIGVDLDNMQASVDRILAEPELLAKISISGRQWALENYSPITIAQYFLKTISDN